MRSNKLLLAKYRAFAEWYAMAPFVLLHRNSRISIVWGN